MATLKCKMCGGDLEIQEGLTVCECEYCGSKQTIPNVDDEKKITLFGRAGRLMRACEFDKAAGIFESIVADFPDEAEAYWGLVISKYGIEYVDDPATGKKIPTCHRSSFDSVMDDDNFEQACENADALARSVYREEAKAIEELRKSIIEVSGKEQPYDVFISYKETVENGQRTIDSVIAQDVYEALTSKGYRVFFSRISLEDKLGVEYEPYIFAALNSAKVMLVFGTNYDNYNAVWVKNEWSRFIKLMSGDKSKHLIPCFKDIDAYDMPKEFAKLAAQDMGKVGAQQDLIRGIEKLIGKKEKVVETVIQQTVSGTNADALLKRGMLSVEDGDWGKAENCFEQVLNLNPECGEAYYGKFLVENKCRSVDAYVSGRLTATKNAEKTELEALTENQGVISEAKKKYVVPGFFSESDIADIFAFDRRYSSELRSREAQYSSETQTLENNRDICRAYQFGDDKLKKKIDDAKAVLSEKLKERVEAAKASDKSSIAGKTAAYDKKLKEAEEIAADRSTEAKRRKASKDKKSKITLYTILIVSLLTIAVAIAVNVVIPSVRYNNAVKLYDSGDYDGAIATFEKLGAYKDSTTQLNNCKTEKSYVEAIALAESGNAKEAYEAFEKLGSYKDCQSRMSEMKFKYEEAVIKEANVGDYILFGEYEQDNNTSNGKEDIEWLVLDKEDDRILVLSKYALDSQPYYASFTCVTWESSFLREWMNGDFFNNCFSPEEQSKVKSTNVSADNNPEYRTNPGNATTDNVFSLSVNEMNKYFSTSNTRECKPTEYTMTQSVANSSDTSDGKTACWWWLRTPGYNQYRASYVYHDGSIRCRGLDVRSDAVGVRPAMWISIE